MQLVASASEISIPPLAGSIEAHQRARLSRKVAQTADWPSGVLVIISVIMTSIREEICFRWEQLMRLVLLARAFDKIS